MIPNYLKSLFVCWLCLLASCKTHYSKQKETFSHIELRAQQDNSAAQSMVLPYKLKIDSFVERTIAVCSEELTREGAQTTLGNFMCDAICHQSKIKLASDSIHFFLFNRGGLRSNIPKGSIKVKNVYEVMPFENELVILTLKGEDILRGIPIILSKNHPFLGLNIHVNHLKWEAFLSNGKSIQAADYYQLATSDFIANGGDNFAFLMNPVKRKNTNLKLRDLMIEYCDTLRLQGKQIIPYIDERLQVSK